MRKYRFHIFQDNRGAWRWQLRASNGRVVADGGEGYSSKRNAINGVLATLRIATNKNYLFVDG
jgi:uncharacterized protein YegP (UPF0339 family)